MICVDFAKVTKPFYEIMMKDVKCNWEKRQQKVFKKLEKIFSTEPVLIISDLDKEIRVETNIPDFAIEEVLSMKCENKK